VSFSSGWLRGARGAVNDDIFVAFLHFLLHFFQREVDDVVVVHFQGRHGVTEAQPQAVQQIDLVRGQVGRVRPEDLVKLVPIGQVDFQVNCGF